jgi:hypothetical protein
MAANATAGTLGTVVTVTKETSRAQEISRHVLITDNWLRVRAYPNRVFFVDIAVQILSFLQVLLMPHCIVFLPFLHIYSYITVL